VMVALSALVSGLDAELRRLGYKDSAVVWRLGRWRRRPQPVSASPVLFSSWSSFSAGVFHPSV
jgi:hypothetical protein